MPARPDRGASGAERRFALGLLQGVVLLVGLLRVYLAVRWPSDVLADWYFGSVWALGFVTKPNRQAGDEPKR